MLKHLYPPDIHFLREWLIPRTISVLKKHLYSPDMWANSRTISVLKHLYPPDTVTHFKGVGDSEDIRVLKHLYPPDIHFLREWAIPRTISALKHLYPPDIHF